MYIVPSRDRLLNIITAVLILIIMMSLILTNSPIFSLFDSLLQDFVTGLSFNHPLLNTLVSFLVNPVLVGFYILVLWFLLWGFKHKIIAFWCLCTYFSGEIVGLIMRKIVNRAQPLSHTGAAHASFPSHHVFALSLLVILIYVAAMPYVENRLKRWVIVGLMWLLVIFVTIAQIQLKRAYPLDAVGSILLAYMWVECFEWIYLTFFNKLQNTRVFSHSDFN
ncbi:phosphatase PAP2 family protein [Paucilactobacillus sp. N302-9]